MHPGRLVDTVPVRLTDARIRSILRGVNQAVAKRTCVEHLGLGDAPLGEHRAGGEHDCRASSTMAVQMCGNELSFDPHVSQQSPAQRRCLEISDVGGISDQGKRARSTIGDHSPMLLQESAYRHGFVMWCGQSMGEYGRGLLDPRRRILDLLLGFRNR